MSAKIHKLPSKSTDNKYRILIAGIKRALNNNLAELMQNLFNSADDTLFHLAENASSSSDQTNYFDTMRMLRLERENITQQFIDNTVSNLKPSTTDTTAEDSSTTDELSLVSQEEMEEMVAITSITNKAENHHHEALSHLEARLEHLALKTPLVFNKNALAPKQFCENFLEAISPLELQTQIKVIFIKLFDNTFIPGLESIYTAVNDALIKADILPQIKLKTPASPASSQHSSTAPADTTIDNTNNQYYSLAPVTSPAYNATPSTTPLAAQTIQNTIQQFIQSNIPPSAITNINNQQYYDRKQVVKALSNLQNNISLEQNTVDFSAIRRALMTNIGSKTGGAVTKQVNHVDEKTIEIIELLFNEILGDDNLTSAVKTLILRLQIPVIKVAMLDPQFFSDDSHPARTFLNVLAHTGIGLTTDKDSLFDGIEFIIDTLLNEYEQDSISFQRALDAINRLINREFSNSIETEESTQRQVLREHARQIVLKELQNQSRGKSLPEKIRPLVLKLWSTQMYQRYLNHGKDSEEWIDSVTLLKQLIDSIQPPKNLNQLQALVQNQDNIIEQIQQHLIDSRQDIEKINLAILNLQSTYIDLTNKADITDEDSAYSNNTLQATEDDIFSVHTSSLTDDDRQAEAVAVVKDKREKLQLLPSTVRPGMWFEIYDGDDKPVRRLKLSVIIMEDALLIFVNRQGVKILEKDAEEFAEELDSGTSKIIADHSVFDRALSNVITTLSSKAAIN